MKKSFFFMAALLVAMTGCNKEPHETTGNGLNPEDKVYMEFQIQTLTTRSSTDTEEGDDYVSSDANPSVEVGKDYENKISSVDVVLRSTNSFVSATVVDPTAGQDDGNYKTWVAQFESSQLETGVPYEVYIYVNCSAKQDLNATSDAAISTIADKTNGKFWMTSAYTPSPMTFTEFSTDKTKPTDIGTHYVERVMARFDYMPKGPYTLGEGVQVTLTEAALINQSKAFYMLRRVSADGTNANWAVGGVEMPTNYVVDTDWEAKANANGYVETLAANFDAHLTNPAYWIWKSIAVTDLTEADNWNGTDDGTTDYDGTHDLNDYYIWQYAKENTIPGDFDNQQNGLSTGIVFKGKLSGDLVTAANKAPIYVFENVLYGTWDKVVAAAGQSNASESLKFAVSVCNNNGQAKDAATLAAAGFTGYSADAKGDYYTYYYYWNRHNDNADNTSMGQMEFAVVRNNVYKLCVDSISKYGHPTPGGTDPDPDPVDPTDPDEEGEYYFKVTVKVLPWVVRVNHIEF